MTFDFSNLTPAQSSLIGMGGWTLAHVPNPQPGPRTVAKLIARGLLVQDEAHDRAGPFVMVVRTYSLAPGVRVAWAAHRATMRERAKERGRASAYQLWRTRDLEWGFGPRGGVTWCGFGHEGLDRARGEAEACS